jgi:hypothetical protein
MFADAIPKTDRIVALLQIVIIVVLSVEICFIYLNKWIIGLINLINKILILANKILSTKNSDKIKIKKSIKNLIRLSIFLYYEQAQRIRYTRVRFSR